MTEIEGTDSASIPNEDSDLAIPIDCQRDRVLFLLGAGASAEGGLPLSREITRLALKDLDFEDGRYHRQEISAALRYVCGALIKFDSDRGGVPTDLPDIERLVSAVELLSQRDDLEVSPFVRSWDPSADEIGHARWPLGFERSFRQALDGDFHGQLESLLREAIRSEIGTGEREIYGELLLRLVHGLRKWVHIPNHAEFAYLSPLLSTAHRNAGLSICTLNYDLSLEGQAEQLGMTIDTGIQSWGTTEEMKWSDSAVVLLKLHGSVGWSFVQSATDATLPSEEGVVESSDPLNDHFPPAVVFGRREKLRAKGPFLEIFSEFSKRLARSDWLVTIGYSFQDDHVNEVIRRWTNRSKDRRILVIDPEYPTFSSFSPIRDDFRIELNWGLLPRPSNLPGVGDIPQRLFVIRKGARGGLFDLGLTEVS